MAEENSSKPKQIMQASRVLIIGLAAVILVLGLALVALVIGRAAGPAVSTAEPERTNALATSDNECVECHRNTIPGIVEQYGHSTMAAAEVSCEDCHEVESGYPGAVEHEGTFVLQSPSAAMCEKCHDAQVAQFNQSRHGLPAYVAMWGTEDLSPEHLAMYEAIPEGGFNPDRMRNALFKLEGPDVTRFACQGCHNIGRPHEDGSVGECQQCHLRHEFSLEQAPQAGKPVTIATLAPIILSGKSIRNHRTALLMLPAGIAGTGRPSPAR